eukprot:TRINITY_DN4881_c0_g1_i9.p1 TRINITY_DN4881_c0_g1~~TRINITY_DN4881_c0_g1_i9.p1  ORF type:complete len:189 (+),score=46.70 TRINITY_DN4881_c0_g1_i9:449-1015(+)
MPLYLPVNTNPVSKDILILDNTNLELDSGIEIKLTMPFSILEKRDVYSEYFKDHEHVNLVGQNKTKKEFYLLSILRRSRQNFHEALVNYSGGFKEIFLVHYGGFRNIVKSLQNTFPNEAFFQLNPQREIYNAIAEIELDNPINIKKFSVGILYAGEGQFDPLQLMKNGIMKGKKEIPKSLKIFLNSLD